MRKSFKHEQPEPRWQSFDQQQQKASMENDARAPSTLDPSLLGTSAYNPSGTFKQPSWTVQQFQPLPDWGWKNAAQDVSNAVPNIINDAKAYQQLGTESLSNQAAQQYLNKVVHGTLDTDAYGQPATDANGLPTGERTFAPANIQTGPGGTTITTPSQFQNKTAIDLGLSNFNQGAKGQPANNPQQNLINSLKAGVPHAPQSSAIPASTSSPPTYPTAPYKNAVASSIASGNTTASSDPSSGVRSTDTPPADAPSDATFTATPSSLSDTSPLASAGSGASAAGTPSSPPAKPVPYAPVKDTSSPTPLDDPSANRSHFTADEVLSWHNKYVNTDGVSARQEFDPTSGLPTNRNIVTLKDGSQQPISSAYILAHKNQNPGTSDDWETPPAASSNPVLGTDPAKVAAAAEQQAAPPLDPAKVAAANAAATQPSGQTVLPSPAYGYGNSGSTLAPQLGPPSGNSLTGPPPIAPTGGSVAQLADPSISETSPPAAHAVPAPPPSEQAPTDWASSPQDTTAAINQMGSDPEAANRQLAGVRTTDPSQGGVRPVRRAVPVDGPGTVTPLRAQSVPGAPVPMPSAASTPGTTTLTPIPQRTPTNLPSYDGPTDSASWSKWTGSSNPKDFGQIAFNPNNWTGPKGNGPVTASGVQTQWKDIYSAPKQGGDGQLHRVYIDPSRDGGRMSYSSTYIRSGVQNPTMNPDGSVDPNASGTHEHRSYLDGTEQDVDNKPLASEIEQMGNLVIKHGTGVPGVPYSQMTPKDQEAAYRAALQKENYEHPLDGEDEKQVKNLWQVMQLAQHQQDVIKGMTPKDHNDWSVAANNFANTQGSKVPDWAGGLVKHITGYDIQHPNPKLLDLMQTHSDIAQSVRALTMSPRYNEKGEEHLDTQIGNPLGEEYPQQLSSFLHNYIYPDAGRAVDIAMSKRQAVPKDFYAAQSRLQYQDSAPGTASHPIIVKSQADEDKAAKGDTLMDSRGKPYIKTWD